MSSIEHFNITTFTDTTKKVCTCSAISIFLILLFIISPLGKLVIISTLVKLGIILLLAYTFQLNMKQTDDLKKAKQMALSQPVSSQLSINIICSYVFTLFIGLLIIFVIKSLF